MTRHDFDRGFLYFVAAVVVYLFVWATPICIVACVTIGSFLHAPAPKSGNKNKKTSAHLDLHPTGTAISALPNGIFVDTPRVRQGSKNRAHSRILRLEREVLRPENFVQSLLSA